MPPFGKGKKASLKIYWLRVAKPAGLLTTKREVDEVISQLCHLTTLRAQGRTYQSGGPPRPPKNPANDDTLVQR
jgi:hypothetical protein